MTFTYTYDPSQISTNPKDRLRMELGDTQVEHGAETTALSDQEYDAIVDFYMTKEKRGFNFTKYKCLEVIYMKMAYEVDTGIGPLNYKLSERAKMWKDLYFTMKKSYGVPTANDSSLGKGRLDDGHYFHTLMLENPRALFGGNMFHAPLIFTEPLVQEPPDELP